jgi:hypothetical protein
MLSKLLVALVASAFTLGAYAQTPAPKGEAKGEMKSEAKKSDKAKAKSKKKDAKKDEKAAK